MSNDLVISFFDCFKAEETFRFSFAGERILPGRVFRFVPSYSFGCCFSLTGSADSALWRVSEKCRRGLSSVCLTVGILIREVKRRSAFFFRASMRCIAAAAGRRLLARMSILRV